jgi:hypothetical protein
MPALGKPRTACCTATANAFRIVTRAMNRAKVFFLLLCLLATITSAFAQDQKEKPAVPDVWFRPAPNFGGFLIPDRKTAAELFGSEDAREVLVFDVPASGKRYRVSYRAFFSGRSFIKEVVENERGESFWIVRKAEKESRIPMSGAAGQGAARIAAVFTNGVHVYADREKLFRRRDDVTQESLTLRTASGSNSLRIISSPTDVDCEPLVTVVRGEPRSGPPWERVFAVRLPKPLPSPCQQLAGAGLNLDWTVGGDLGAAGHVVYLGDGTALIHGSHHVLRIRLSDGDTRPVNASVLSMTPEAAIDAKQRVDRRLRGGKSLKDMPLPDYFETFTGGLAAELFHDQGATK